MRIIFCLFCFISLRLFASDTLFTHPQYPPIVYENGEYDFYKYNPKFIPNDLMHCFKILGTAGDNQLNLFSKRSTEEILERGIYERGYRLRKEFCLDSYSAFTQYFHSFGIYAPYAMQSFILLSFHQYLNQERIRWSENKKIALKNLKKENRSSKKRSKKLYRQFENRRNNAEVEIQSDPAEDDWLYKW